MESGGNYNIYIYYKIRVHVYIYIYQYLYTISEIACLVLTYWSVIVNLRSSKYPWFCCCGFSTPDSTRELWRHPRDKPKLVRRPPRGGEEELLMGKTNFFGKTEWLKRCAGNNILFKHRHCRHCIVLELKAFSKSHLLGELEPRACRLTQL